MSKNDFKETFSRIFNQLQPPSHHEQLFKLEKSTHSRRAALDFLLLYFIVELFEWATSFLLTHKHAHLYTAHTINAYKGIHTKAKVTLRKNKVNYNIDTKLEN